MKFLMIAGVSLAFGVGAAQAQSIEPVRSLDFLVGEWRLSTVYEYEGQEPFYQEARKIVTPIFGGKALRIEETHPAPENQTFYSEHILIYHEESGVWRSAGNNSFGNRKMREGRWEGDSFIFIESGELFGGREGFNRHIMHDVSSDSFQLRIEQSADGVNWRKAAYSYTANRVKPDAD